jgi:hypothetical protein
MSKLAEKATRQGEGADLELVQTAIHYLMTKYVIHPDGSVAAAIIYHLELLRNQPGFRKNAGLYRYLSDVWRNVIDGRQPEESSSGDDDREKLH